MDTLVMTALKEVVEKEVQSIVESAKGLKHKGLINEACCLAMDALKKASQFKIQILKDFEIRELIKLEIEQCIRTIASISGSSTKKAMLEKEADCLATEVNKIEPVYYREVLNRIEEAKQKANSQVFGETLNIPVRAFGN